MSRKPLVLTVLAAITVALAFMVVRPALSAATPVRIMPLGDSITGGPGCWRALLWDRLQRTGFTNIDFVGTIPGGGCSVAHDGDNEGHGGFLATGIANQNLLPGWLAATRPDVVLMHLGTNDVWNNVPAATIISAFNTLIDQMRASNPNMRILVAQIIPMAPAGCTWCPPGVTALNNAIPGWAAGRSTAASPITVVDQFTGFDPVADTTGDGVHPDDSGFQKMSDRWYPPLTTVLGGITPTSSTTTTTRTPTTTTRTPTTTTRTPTPTRSVTPSRSATPSTSAGACSTSYTVVNQWAGGFQADVSVRNTSTAASSAWTATLTFANGQVVTQAWNATVTQTGASATARNTSYNGSLAPGAAVTFGFLGSWNGANAAPSVTCALS
jgi:lysophospholipase L1-like esterase